MKYLLGEKVHDSSFINASLGIWLQFGFAM
jgi:hypothetical protein